jgi:hypothetical protein
MKFSQVSEGSGLLSATCYSLTAGVGQRLIVLTGGSGVVTVRGLVVAVGFVVAVGSAAFLVRGGSLGIGVVTVFGLVVVGSAAFLVRWQLVPE